MKKIINERNTVTEDMLTGFLSAYPQWFQRIGSGMSFLYKGHRKKQVSLVIGGGSGHEPMFCGFAGKGLADAVVCGNIFAAPNPQLILETARAVDQGHGVLFLYGNYAGDNLNFDVAEELCACEGIVTGHIRVQDDCASAPKHSCQDRRGIAGDVFAIKIAGAACDAGLDLLEVRRITQKACNNIRTIGLATQPGTVPSTGNPTFSLGESEIEYGMGMHGEPGIERTAMKSANALTERMYQELQDEMELCPEEEVAVLVNSLGSTTLLELSIVNKRLSELLKEDGIQVVDCDLHSYVTCQEMGGFSITLFRLDEELKRYYNAPCWSPYYAKNLL